MEGKRERSYGFIMGYTYDRCPNCMNPYDGSSATCPYCGMDVTGYISPENCLYPFTILQDKYMVGRVLGQGGFGITYIGYDMNLATYVAIKEFFPESIALRSKEGYCTDVFPQEGREDLYNKNLNRFVEEARNLSKFYSLPGIVSVRNFFYGNGTAYIVMDYVAGDNLKKYIADNGGRVDESTVLRLMKPVLESLNEIHKQGLIHRDISPDNIMFDQNGDIKLIDFGAVRGQSMDMDMTYTVMLKHGYAPQEQYYAKGKQGPWTDIYSICATMYKMLTGTVPPNCIERMSQDTYMPPSQCGVSISSNVEMAISKGLSVSASDRYQNVGELIADLYGDSSSPANVAGVEQYLQPQTVEQNSDSDVKSEAKKKSKKIIPIVIGIVVALIILVVCLKVFVLDKKDKPGKGTEEPLSTTEVDNATGTDATATDATDTDATLQLDGTWSDMKIMIDGELYQFPMTYDQWIAHGWVADMDVTLEPGEVLGIRCHNDKLSCSVSLANYSNQTLNGKNCMVIGFLHSFDYYYSEQECIITLPGDIIVNTNDYEKSDTIQKALDTYGHAEYENLQELVSVIQYQGDNGDYLTLYGNDRGSIYYVDFACYKTPEDADIVFGSTTDVVPYNEKYEYPGNTTDRFDDIFCIDGVNYKLWGPVSQYVENGWTIECEKDVLDASYACEAVLRKGDASFTVWLGNPTLYTLDIGQTRVTEINLVADECSGIEVILPGGVKLGDNANLLNTLYSDVEGFNEIDLIEEKHHSLNEYGVKDGCITFYIVSLPEDSDGDGEVEYYISEYSYERKYSASRADLDNVDYIQGITVDR